MEEYDYLNADKDACLEVLEKFKDSNENIDYSKAMQVLI